MGLIGSAARAYLLHRAAGGGRRRSSRHRGYGTRRSPYGQSRRRSNFGFFGPFPSYSRRTRGGSRVHVSGCCLPIPLAMTVGAATAVRVMTRR